jgi:hypothetical protein
MSIAEMLHNSAGKNQRLIKGGREHYPKAEYDTDMSPVRKPE